MKPEAGRLADHCVDQFQFKRKGDIDVLDQTDRNLVLGESKSPQVVNIAEGEKRFRGKR